MDYRKLYDALILKAQNRTRLPEVYYEKHHIIPKSLGGTDEQSNLVHLTLREHFICHLLLYKFCEGDDKWRMGCALHRFLYTYNGELLLSSRTFEMVRQYHRQSVSTQMKGRKQTDQARRNMKKAQRKYFDNNSGHFLGKTHSDETKKLMSDINKGENNPCYGRSRPDDERRRISETLKGVPKSADTIAKFKQRKDSEETRRKRSESIREWHRIRKENAKMASQVSPTS